MDPPFHNTSRPASQRYGETCSSRMYPAAHVTCPGDVPMTNARPETAVVVVVVFVVAVVVVVAGVAAVAVVVDVSFCESFVSSI